MAEKRKTVGVSPTAVPKFCPYCGGAAIKFVGLTPRCTDCRAVFFLSFSRWLRKELRDSSVTFALQAGADPWYVARQHGHSLTVMMKDYAKWIPNADRNRNRNTINTALAAPVQKEGTNDNTNET